MSDLIRREDAIEAVAEEWLSEASAESPYVNDDDEGEYRKLAEELLADIPSADAVEVVRCGECKHWEGEERNGFYYFKICSRTKLDALYDDFCSYGEKVKP